MPHSSPARIECESLCLMHSNELLDYAIANKDHLAPWEPLREGSGLQPKTFEQLLRNQLAEQEQGRALRLVLRELCSRRVVGTISFTNICPEPFLACHLGYSLAAASQGKGLMAEGLRMALRRVFNEHGLHRVMANYISHNERSAAVLRRLGFSVEGYARAYLRIAGRWEDHVLTSLIREDAEKMLWWTPDA
jgi:ribosomal-protein-alanine N-acetyltransferase